MWLLAHLTLVIRLTFPLKVSTLEEVPAEVVVTQNRHLVIVRQGLELRTRV